MSVLGLDAVVLDENSLSQIQSYPYILFYLQAESTTFDFAVLAIVRSN